MQVPPETPRCPSHRGDYIQRLDSDDVPAPDKVAVQMKEAEPGHSSRTLLSGAWGRFYRNPRTSRFVPPACGKIWTL